MDESSLASISIEDRLKNLPYLQPLSAEQLKELVGMGRTEYWDPNSTIFAEGAPGNSLYVILGGRVRIYKKNETGTEVELATLGKGELVGELALLDESPRSATATTIDPCVFFVLDREIFIGLLTQYPQLIPGLLANISSKIRTLNEKFFLDVLEKQALRLRIERESYRSLVEFAAFTNEALSVEDVMQVAVDRICSYTEWPIGHVCVVDKNAGGGLFSSPVWRLKAPEKLAPFQKASEFCQFLPGMDVPGKVLATRKPAWISDVTKIPNSPRAKVAAEIGILSGFGFPVLVNKEVGAVLEFFSEKASQPDKPLSEAIAAIGSQLGQFIERKQWEEKLLHDAFHDPLTDLPNRALFLDRLGLSLSRTERHKDYLFGVIYMDLDRFKMINDSMGHRVGDQFLVEVGRRLVACLRTTDTVARLGGDEFAILLDDIKHISDVPRTIERLRNQLLLPLNLEGHEVFTTASMGIALSSTGYEQPEDLLRDADTAMYRAKAQGQGRHAVFDVSMHEQAVRLLKLETDLRRAIERQELRLHYQPIISLHTGKIAGFEALVRWQHPERGLLSPNEFLPVAEDSQLIIPLTRWVLQEACGQARIWRAQFPPGFAFHISTNLTAKYLVKQDLLEEIGDLIAANGLAPEHLRLEITESQIIEDPGSVSKALLRLSDFGVKVSIDDFGTGYSSLSYLSSFPVHALKIDRSFVWKMGGDDKNSAIVRSIVSLAHNLGLEVVAEGIEKTDQLDYLREVKCQYGQGFLFYPPLDKEKASQLIPEWSGVRTEKTEKKVDYSRFRTFELFPDLDDECLAEVAKICETVTVPSGSVVIRQGMVGDKVFLLEEGSVGIYRGESETPQFLAVLHAPTVFGETAIVNSGRIRTANVKALSDLRVLTIPLAPFLNLLQRFPALRKNLLDLVAERSLG